MDGKYSGWKPKRPLIAAEDNGHASKRFQASRPEDGEIAFRVLCPEAKAGGVIGKGGSIISQIRRETGARISVQETVQGCEERVILISAPAEADHHPDFYGAGERLSPVQDALLRVHARIAEDMANEKEANGVVITRLIVPNNQVGCLMGKGGKIIQQMRDDTKAQIRILPREQNPPCADPTDEEKFWQSFQHSAGVPAPLLTTMAISLRRDAIRTFMNRVKYLTVGEHFRRLEFGPHNTCSYSSNATQNAFDAGQPTTETHPELVAAGEITPGITGQEFLTRRKKLLELLPEKSLIIMTSAPVKMMTDVVPYPFRQDADYLYFTGCQQPGGIAVLNHEFGLCMFMPDSKPEEEIWTGQVAGTHAALNTFKADRTFSISKLHELLPDMIRKSHKLYHNRSMAGSGYVDLPAFKNALKDSKVHDLCRYTHEVRWIKSPSEINIMRLSAATACQALLRTMMVSKTCPHEHILAATVEYECKIRGAQRMAFHPVVGGGANGSVIHYSRNDQQIKEGEMVLMDVGCEIYGYVSDLTRTWPPYGSFSPAQQELYELILDTANECLKLCKPGVSLHQIHTHSVQLLSKGLKELGILKNSMNLSRSYRQFNPTSIGHYLGMDVHDCSSISGDRPLQAGVVITIEPGVYIPMNSSTPERFQGIGIRIEDEVLITDSGHEVLTASVPKEIKQIQSLLC